MQGRTVKLVLVGPSGVGKSALRGKYITGRFFSGYRTTIGADFISKTLAHPTNPEDSVTLQIWDTAGQERFSSLSNAFFRGADAAILMFDVNTPSTLQSLTRWWSDFCERAPIDEERIDEFCCVLVGNKIDLEARQLEGEESGRVSEGEALEFLRQLIPSYSPLTPQPLNGTTTTPHTASPTILNGHTPHPPSISIDINPPDSAGIIKPSLARRLRSKFGSLSSSRLSFSGFNTTSSIQSATSAVSNYHTPSSSLFEDEFFLSAPSSPFPPSSLRDASSPTTPNPNFTTRRAQSRSRRRVPSTGTTLSNAETVTPSLYARAVEEAETEAETTVLTIPDDTINPITDPHPFSPLTASASSNSHGALQNTPPRPPYRGPKLFFTSAKTGQGVNEVFEYIADRVARMAEYEEQIEARRLHVREASGPATIRLSDVLGGFQRWTCCST